MLIGGLQKTTLIDYPGKVACTVFTVGCNFFCPYCHNRDLVSLKNFNQSSLLRVDEKDFFDFLAKRKNILDGVCITGGEPTVQPDLASFCRKIKNLGLLVKLDTNGGRPEIVEDLVKKGLIDFIAMDIKSDRKNYSLVTKVDYRKIAETIALIITSGLDYQLRTTLVPTIHNLDNLSLLAKEIKNLAIENGVNYKTLVWRLQKFLPQNCLDEKFNQLSSFTGPELESLLAAARSVIPQVSVGF